MVLREIKKKGIFNILVDTDPHNMEYFFRSEKLEPLPYRILPNPITIFF